MEKGGVVLGLIGILIGAGGFVFGVIAWSSLNTIQTQIDNVNNIETWYNSDNTTFAVSPSATVLELTNLTISFELTSTASVYMSFTCMAEIQPLGGTSAVFFLFKVDGVLLTSPAIYVGTVNAGTTVEFFSVNLQHNLENMNSGIHTITPQVSSNTNVNSITEMALFVQIST
jgi:hypothetical protein